MGRPTKLNEETAKRIVQLVRAGNWFETACAAAEVTSQTVRNWIRKGTADLKAGRVTEAAAFARSIESAGAYAEARIVNEISKAVSRDWRAGAWILSKKNPERFGDRVRNENVEIPPGPATAEQLRRAAEVAEQLERLEREAAERRGT